MELRSSSMCALSLFVLQEDKSTKEKTIPIRIPMYFFKRFILFAFQVTLCFCDNESHSGYHPAITIKWTLSQVLIMRTFIIRQCFCFCSGQRTRANVKLIFNYISLPIFIYRIPITGRKNCTENIIPVKQSISAIKMHFQCTIKIYFQYRIRDFPQSLPRDHTVCQKNIKYTILTAPRRHLIVFHIEHNRIIIVFGVLLRHTLSLPFITRQSISLAITPDD